MALFTPSQSPAVVVKEIDATGGVPNVQTSTGAYVGNFRWGPAEEPVLVSGEAGLISTFAAPREENAQHIDFNSCVQFLQYSNSLQVIRMLTDSARSAVARKGQQSTANGVESTDGNYQIKNENSFLGQKADMDAKDVTFVSKYVGKLGNSLAVQMQLACDSATFRDWDYASSFDGTPGTSAYTAARDGKADEVHLVVVDSDGAITGSKGTVLEAYPFMSLALDAKSPDGASLYMPDVINRRSQYIKMVDFFDDLKFEGSTAGLGHAGSLTEIGAGSIKSFFDSTKDSASTVTAGNRRIHTTFHRGVDNGVLLTETLIDSGFGKLADKEKFEVDYLIAPSFNDRTTHASAVNKIVSLAENTRKDCVVLASPARDDVVGQHDAAAITTDITRTSQSFTSSSYLMMDGNFIKVYDKFNDKFIEIPGAAATAGLLAATDLNQAPWFSPAGGRRGRYFNVAGINYNPDKSQRDQLYRENVNPITNLVGQGIILFGDKTKLGRSSAFDRINVRRLFLVLERAIAEAAKNVLFEFNDEFTRTEFVNIIEPVLRDVKGRRGITDFRIIADETVNTPAVVDRNEFIANIFIKPARSINFVTLNFTAVRTGVEFEEIVGTVGV